MNRAIGLIVHNWPLKLGAIAFATLLYGGLILSSSAQLFEGAVPIETSGLSPSVTILSDLGAVRRIRYLAPEDLGLRLDSSSFRAVVDLSKVSPTGGRTSVAVRVIAVDPRIQVVDYEPRQITVQLDEVISRIVPIRAVLGPIPSGLDIGEPILSANETTVTGAASIINQVAEAQARLSVDASGIDINRIVDLLPVDAADQVLFQVDLSPANVRVRLAIFTDRQTRSLPVRPIVVGTTAVGFEVASVTGHSCHAPRYSHTSGRSPSRWFSASSIASLHIRCVPCGSLRSPATNTRWGRISSSKARTIATSAGPIGSFRTLPVW